MKRAHEMILVVVLFAGTQCQARRHCQNLKSVHALFITMNMTQPTFSGIRYHEVTVITLFCAARRIPLNIFPSVFSLRITDVSENNDGESWERLCGNNRIWCFSDRLSGIGEVQSSALSFLSLLGSAVYCVNGPEREQNEWTHSAFPILYRFGLFGE